MSEVTIYHNPRCSKSRQTLELLNEKGIEPDITLFPVSTVNDVRSPSSRTSDARQVLSGPSPKNMGRADPALATSTACGRSSRPTSVSTLVS